MKRIRKRITYANVMSSIAVFLVLGGASAYAAKKIGSNEIKGNSITTGKLKKNAVTASKIKSNSITTAKIKNSAVTGPKINLTTLGKVPSATTADTATNANAVNDQTANKIFKILTPGQTNAAVATVAGFKVTASCASGDADLEITPPAGPASVLNSEGTTDNKNETTFSYEGNEAGEAFGIRLDELSEGGGKYATFGLSSVSAATSAGTTISGVLGYDYDTFGGESPERCVIYGHLLAG